MSTASTTAQVVTETPRSNQLPQRFGLAPSIPETNAAYGVKTPSDPVPRSNQPIQTSVLSASIPEIPAVSTATPSISAAGASSDGVETPTVSETVSIG